MAGAVCALGEEEKVWSSSRHFPISVAMKYCYIAMNTFIYISRVIRLTQEHAKNIFEVRRDKDCEELPILVFPH